MAGLAGASLGIILLGVWYFKQNAPYNGPTAEVVREKLQITVKARGTLESAKNGDIVCLVRARAQGSTIASSIKWLIDNGEEVKKGDKVIELDDSGLREQLKAQSITVDSAKSAEVTAFEKMRSDDIQSQIDIEKAENARRLAEIDLRKYKLGDYVQALKDVDGRIETAKSDLESWQERFEWSKRMLKKGLMSKVQTDADESRRDGARFAFQKVEEEKRVLVNYIKRRTEQDLTAKLKEAKRGLEKTQVQTKALHAQDEAEHQAKRSIYEQELAKKKDIESEITKCLITAPQDGLVVYYVPEQVRGGGGSQQSIIAQGEPVREGQKMMQIPDLTQMLVNVRVPEAFKAHLHNADPSNPKSWQPALIRVDAFSSRVLKGYVKMVDNVSSQQDFFASDVKVYKTLVRIEDPAAEDLELCPGLSAEVTIFADETPTPVLVVPVQAVIGSISSGTKRKCFVIGSGGQPEMREIIVGKSNERSVEVEPWDEKARTGLKEGERVVENPRPLLGEDSELKPGKVRKIEADHDQGGADPTKKGKKGKGGNGPPSPGGPPKGGETIKGPNGGLSGPGAEGKGFGGPPTPEQIQQMRQKTLDTARGMTPAQRRDMINQVPEAYREQVRQLLRDNKLEIAN